MHRVSYSLRWLAYTPWMFASVHPCLCLFCCGVSYVRARAHVRLPACSVAMMALFWMIDVFEGAARSSGWARASVWHAAASLLLYICRRSKTPSPLPSDCSSRSNTANTRRFLFGGGALFLSSCLFHKNKLAGFSNHFLFHSTSKRMPGSHYELNNMMTLCWGVKI